MKSFLRKFRHRTIIKEIFIPENSFVLDTSCQDGGFLSELSNKNIHTNAKFYGVDINEKEIEKARKLYPQFDFRVGDSTYLKLGDQLFDVVISSLTLHHLSNPQASILEMKRMLKPGGHIYLIDIIAKSKIFYSILRRIKCPEKYHFEKFYYLPDIIDLLSKNGLRVEKVDRVFLFPTISIVMPVLVLKISM